MKEPSPKSALLFAVFLFVTTSVVVGSLIWFRLNYIQEVEEPAVAELAKPDETTASLTQDASTCLLEVQSDPSEATVSLNGVDRGLTPLEMPVPCKSDVDIKLEKEGFVSFRRNDYVFTKRHRVYAPLKPIPLGTLELTLSHDATVYVNNSKRIEAREREPFELKLPANNRYRIRFVNDRLGISEEREYFIRKDQTQEETIRLDRKG